jgi:hypothetical protein
MDYFSSGTLLQCMTAAGIPAVAALGIRMGGTVRTTTQGT